MTIIEAQKFGAKQLKEAKIPSAILDAEVLLSYTIKKSKEFIFTNPKTKITKLSEIKYKSLIKKRKRYHPVAYLVGQKQFYSLNILVNKNVLIPRPETELLIDEVIKFAKNKKLIIIDIGTGSGAIAIAIKKNLPDANVIASDISKRALSVAKINAKKNKTDIEFIHSDLLSGISNTKIDIIVANLPYVPKEEKKSNNSLTRSLKYEPIEALYSGKYGLDEYTKLFEQIKYAGIKPQAIFCEIGNQYIDKTKELAKKNFPDRKIKIKKDLCGKNRLLIIT